MEEAVRRAMWSPAPQPGSATHCLWGSVTSFLWLRFLVRSWEAPAVPGLPVVTE